jgi:soluble lytic murein transglycosylase-like protein
MRICIIAAAIIALTQPALAAKSHKKKSHRHHVSHLTHHHHYARDYRGRAFVRADAADRPAFFNPFFPNWSWQQAWEFPAARETVPSRGRTSHVHHGLDAAIARHAAANGVPVSLVHRVVKRESGYNPRARNGSNLGLMQIKYATARGVGYTGSASGLMDPETNLTYATRYLAGAYRAAGGNQNRAVALYASGYHGRGVPRETRMAATTPWQAWTTQWQAQAAQGEWW